MNISDILGEYELCKWYFVMAKMSVVSFKNNGHLFE